MDAPCQSSGSRNFCAPRCVHHYLGRFRQGLEPEESVVELADWVLNLEEWIEPNGAELVRRARLWA